MKAVGLSEFGGPEVLGVVDLPDPQPGLGQVRVRVHAAAINPSDTVLRSGAYPSVVSGLPAPWIPGWDLAGVIDRVGDGVDHTMVGRAVMGAVFPTRPGAYAELVCLSANAVVDQPSGIGHPTAATITMNGLTALRILDLLALPVPSTVAVTGAAGFLGGFIIELSRARGLQVIADAAPADLDRIRALGASIMVPRGPQLSDAIREAVPEGADALVDTALLGDDVVGAIRDEGALAVLRQSEDISPGRGITVHRVSVADYLNHPDQPRLRDAVEQGNLTPHVADLLPPERAAEAHTQLEAGGTRGRLVLDFSPS